MAIRYTCSNCGLSLTVDSELPNKMCPQCMIELTEEETVDDNVRVAKAVVNATLTSSSRIAAARTAAVMSSETAEHIHEVVESTVAPSTKTGDLDYVKNLLEAKICELALKEEELTKLSAQKKESRETAKAWYQYAQTLEEKIKGLEERNLELLNKESFNSNENDNVEKTASVEEVLNSSEMEAKKLEAAKQMKTELWGRMMFGTAIFMGIIVYCYLLLVRPNVKEDTGAMCVIVFTLIPTLVAAYFFIKEMKSAIEKGKIAKENMRLRKEQSIKVQAEAKKAKRAAKLAAQGENVNKTEETPVEENAEVVKEQEVVGDAPVQEETVSSRGATPSRKLSSAAAKQAIAARAAAAKRR